MSTWIAARTLGLAWNSVCACLAATLALSRLRPPSRIVYALGDWHNALTVSKPRPVLAPVIKITGLEAIAVFFRLVELLLNTEIVTGRHQKGRSYIVAFARR